MIILEKLTKSFGTRVVLDSVSCQIAPGEFVCITGPSGAGKSTLMHLMIGQHKPDSGSIIIDETHVEQMDFDTVQLYRRHIGIVFQDYKLLPNKTVYENVAFALEVCGEPLETIHTLVPKALDQVGLLRRQNQYPRELSGGEAQRTAIARALVHNPKMILLDEPTGNLDKAAAKSIVDILRTINAAGTTVLMTTHNSDIIQYIDGRMIILEQGQITFDGKANSTTASNKVSA